jgi:FAD/FMN-containing dehydrogenase
VVSRSRSAVAGEVRLSLHDRMLYATDASLYQVEPIGVVIPADTDDAARAVRVLPRRTACRCCPAAAAPASPASAPTERW